VATAHEAAGRTGLLGAAIQAGDRDAVYELNARRVYPRLDAALRARDRAGAGPR